MPDDWRRGLDRKVDLLEERIRDADEKLRAGNPKIRIQVDRKRGVVSSISKIQPKSRELEHGSPGDEKDQMSFFLVEQQDIFGLRNSREELSWDQDLLEEMGGDAWLGLRQLHQGIPVHGASMWAWFSRAAGGRVLNQINNKCVPDIDIGDVTPKLSAAEALGKALERYWPDKLALAKKAARAVGLPLEPKSSLEIVEQEGFRLCHVVKVPAEKNRILRVMTCYIDAMTGDFLFAYDGLRSGQGKGYYTASRRGPLQTLPSLGEDGKHKLIDKSRPGGPTITIYALSSPDLDQISEDGLDISPPLSQKEISCGENGIWNRTSQEDRKNDQRPEVDAMLYAGQIVDYFRYTHHWNSFNDAGHDVRIGVHWGKNLNNACFDTHMQAIYLGDGDGRLCGFWTTRDVITHEFTHGITHHTAGFFSREEQVDKRKSYQYSALDEAFSDIFALFINWPDEEIGTQLIRDNRDGEDSLALVKPGRPWDRNQIIRFLGDDTPEKGTIINHVLKACDFKSNRGYDNEEDPHINAGIIEFAAYLMIKGGTHPGSKIKVDGIGKEAAERLFFRALTKWIGQKNGNATFMECRKALCDAVTKDLHKNDPGSAVILESVKDAFTAVGIGPDLYIPCKKDDDGSRSPAAPLPDASPYIEILAAGSPEQQKRSGGAGAYDIYVTVRNRGTNPDQTQFAVSIFWENPTGSSEDSILKPIGSTRDAIEPRDRTNEEVGPVSERRVGPIRWPADKLPDRSPVRLICAVDGYDDDPEPEMEMIRSVETVDLYLKSSNNFAWRNFEPADCAADG